MPTKPLSRLVGRTSKSFFYFAFFQLLTSCSLPRSEQSFTTYSASDWVGVLSLLGIAALAYMLPTVVAICTRHPAVLGIGFLNLVFGWSGLGWIGSFIWAFLRPAKALTVIQQTFPDHRVVAGPPPIPPRSSAEMELESIQRLRERKLISEEEFLSKRAAILERL